MEDKTEATERKRPILRRGILYALLGGAALVALVAARPIAAAIQDVGGLHRRWAGHWGHHEMNPQAAKEHLQTAAKWALRDIDATQEQQDRVNAIVAGAVDDLFRLRQPHQENGRPSAPSSAAPPSTAPPWRRSASPRWGWPTRRRSGSSRRWPTRPTSSPPSNARPSSIACTIVIAADHSPASPQRRAGPLRRGPAPSTAGRPRAYHRRRWRTPSS